MSHTEAEIVEIARERVVQECDVVARMLLRYLPVIEAARAQERAGTNLRVFREENRFHPSNRDEKTRAEYTEDHRAAYRTTESAIRAADQEERR